MVAEPEAMSFGDAPSRARRILRTNDCIVSTVRTYLRAVAPVGPDLDGAIASTGFAVLTPGPRLHPKYLGWVVQSGPFIDEVVARSTGVSYPAINPSALGQLDIPTPTLRRQRAIADYLDSETARVDALIVKRRRMIDLSDEREAAVIEGEVWNRRGYPVPVVPLRRLAQRISVGIAEAATHAYTDQGVPLLRAMNIRSGWIDDTDLLHIEPWFAEQNRSKSVEPGDVLTVRTGNPGVSAVVPMSVGPCQTFTQLITSVRHPNVSEFVALALNSGKAKEHFAVECWGSAQSNISVPILAAAPIPMMAPVDQNEVVRRVDRERAAFRRSRALLERQVALMVERRQALITAAVTGEFDIPGVAA